MKEDSEQSALWKTVVSHAKVAANNLDQRILISTIAYHVHDLMMEKVKKELSISTEQPSQSSTSDKFTESIINLLRCGGFALHSMLLKRERGMSLKSTKQIQKRNLSY